MFSNLTDESSAFDELDALLEEYDNAGQDKLNSKIVSERTLTAHQVDLHRRAGVTANGYKKTFDWQLSIGYDIVFYCELCYWVSSNIKYRYCPYHTGGVPHGLMSPIEKYLESTIGDI